MENWLEQGAVLPAPLPTYDGCYVCGQANPVGLHIRFFAHPDGEVRADFSPREPYAGYDGIVHGGVISAFLDELAGWTVSLATGLLAYTANLDIRFVRPVHVGRCHVGSARVEEGHGRLWSARGNLLDMKGRVCARAFGRYFLLTSGLTAGVAARMTRHEPAGAARGSRCSFPGGASLPAVIP